MKVVIAGSRSIPPGQAPRLIIRFLAALPDDAVIMLRSPISGLPGQFEQDTARLADALHLERQWCRPEPTATTPGRGSVYFRDIEMLVEADLVLLFFTPEEATDGYSGTAHMLDKALDQERPVYAYTVAEDGAVERVGEYDPDGLYANLAPAP